MRNVAVFIESSTQFGRGLLHGIGRYAQLANWCLHYEQGGLSRVEPDWLRDWKGDGVITRAREQKHSPELARRGVAVLGWPSHDFVANDIPNIDEEAIGTLAAQYFLDKGFRHFAYIGHGNMEWSMQRERAFQGALKEAGHGPAAVRHTQLDGSRSDNMIEDDRHFLHALPTPCAVFCVTDQRGVQILGTARECGRVVPEQLSILGVDNDPLLCQLANPALSSIDTDPEAMGTAVANRLDRLMSGQDPGEARKIPPVGVLERASTASEAVDDPHLVLALAFVRRSAGKRITVDDVTCASGVSRRALEYRFRNQLQTTIAAYLRQNTVEGIRKLLVETDFALPKIAEILGIERLQTLHELFHRVEGCSPGKYRRAYSLKKRRSS
ncbi:MAG: substrate-binding domain-containing protein [Verrucomicrobiales bacterium]|nr:substrate-binding domain-containing protein [Verrucomicrobiales bacterium]